MANKEEQKRLFFGAEVQAPWQTGYLSGRIIAEEGRHITLGFLGAISFTELKPLLSTFPLPSFRFALIGTCDHLLFLPKGHPRVVAAHIEWFEKENPLSEYCKRIRAWIKEHNYPLDKHEELLSHVSLARAPFQSREWEDSFIPLPVMATKIHLYESVGNLNYHPLWTHSLMHPYEEIDHTADIAFKIQGDDIAKLHLHARAALCFKFPPLLSFLSSHYCDSIEEIIIDLNETVAKADEAVGCPFKAVSFHGEITQDEKQILHWEMIVDV